MEPIHFLLTAISEDTSPVRKAEMRQQLADAVNYLLEHDFYKLIQVLYRVDVSEEKLKQFLKENPDTDAGITIADLLLSRQEEKTKFKRTDSANDINEEDKW